MRMPLILLFMSAFGMVASGTIVRSLDLFLLTALCTLASLAIVIFTWLKNTKTPKPAKTPKQKKPKRRLVWKSAKKKVVLDGSNIMHWHNNTPRLDTVRAVISAVVEAGYTPGVIFDANAGYKLNSRYMRDTEFSNLLGLAADKVMVVDAGQSADPIILQAARDFDAPIVTQDNYRDWVQDFPEIETPSKLIKGSYQNGALWIDL